MRKYIFLLFLIGLLFIAYIFLYKILMVRVNAFGCFDDCFNIVPGYFINHKRSLFSQIFFNHQPLMAYVSAAIQSLFHARNIYELVLIHRKVLFVFSFLMNTLLIIRFKTPALGFSIFYEFSKFYIFGDRFLAESFIAYPLVYMLGLVWEKTKKISLSLFDYIFTVVSCWFVLFSREPFALASLAFLFIIFWGKPLSRSKIISIFIFVILNICIVLFIPFSEYFRQVVTDHSNLQMDLQNNNVFGLGMIYIFFYQFLVFFGGKWNVFRILLVTLSVVYIIENYYLFKKKQIMPVIIFLIILGLSNIRYVLPFGRLFYESFHMVPWFALFTALVFFLLKDIYGLSKKVFIVLSSLVIIIFLFSITSKDSYIYTRIDPHVEFFNNYSYILQVGEVIRSLSINNDTLFLDGFDDLIYWQAQRMSSYKYSWYTSEMPFKKRYKDLRHEMFVKYPPDFYYGSCPKAASVPVLSTEARELYVRLYNIDKPTCLFIRKSKLSSISEKQWKKAGEFLYRLPTEEEIAVDSSLFNE